LNSKSLEIVLLHEIVQVERHQLEDNAHVTPEYETVLDVDNVSSIVLVLEKQMFQYLHFLLGLVQESSIISNYLQSHKHFRLVIIGFNNLAKRSAPEDLEDFIAVGNVIVGDNLIGTISIIVAVVTLHGKLSGDLSIEHQRSNEINFVVVENFVSFKRGQGVAVEAQNFLRVHPGSFFLFGDFSYFGKKTE